MHSNDFQKMIQKYNEELRQMQKKAKPDDNIEDESAEPDPIISIMAEPATAEAAPKVPLQPGQFPFSNTFEYPSIPPEQAIKGSLIDLNGKGYLVVRVFTARGAIPIKDAAVIISQEDEKGEKLIASTVTDSAGETKSFELPTVSSEKSQVPGDENPYAAYKIRVTADGYFSIDDINVPIFDGQTAVQPVEMIPLPENFTGNEDLSAVQTGPITLNKGEK